MVEGKGAGSLQTWGHDQKPRGGPFKTLRLSMEQERPRPAPEHLAVQEGPRYILGGEMAQGRPRTEEDHGLTHRWLPH